MSPSWGVADKPDSVQEMLAKSLRGDGWYVKITKRPVDLFVVTPDEAFGFWVEVKSRLTDPLTDRELDFFEECPEPFRIRASSMIEIINHWGDLIKARTGAKKDP